MSHAECPAVLIECAFLSNPEETMLIKSDKYQTKLAIAIISAAICHLSDETKLNWSNQNKCVIINSGKRKDFYHSFEEEVL